MAPRNQGLPPPTGKRNSFLVIFSANSFTGQNDRKGLHSPSLWQRPVSLLLAARSEPINYSAQTEHSEFAKVLTSIFIDSCLMVSQQDKARFPRILDHRSSARNQDQSKPAHPTDSTVWPGQVWQLVRFAVVPRYESSPSHHVWGKNF